MVNANSDQGVTQAPLPVEEESMEETITKLKSLYAHASDQPFSTPVPVEKEVLVEDKGVGRVVTLNRPRVLNCINLTMLQKLIDCYERWEDDDSVHFIILKGAGRVFCAGGDLKMFYNKGKSDESWTEIVYSKYWFDYHIATYKKPLVALWHGLVMGGGAGLSVPGTFGVATEKTVFSMPEAALGLHTDCGSSYWLSRLNGSLGEFLALTGYRLDGGEMYSCGLATHYVPLESLPELEKRLCELPSGDESSIREVIESFHSPVPLPETSILKKQAAIDKIFSKESIEEILSALEEELQETHEPWVKDILKILKRSSPTGLRVTFRSIRTARELPRSACLQREYRLTINALRGTVTDDFYEGIRSIVVEKDNAPKWSPRSTLDVTQESLDLVFKPFEETDELHLPTDDLPRWSTGRFVQKADLVDISSILKVDDVEK